MLIDFIVSLKGARGLAAKPSSAVKPRTPVDSKDGKGLKSAKESKSKATLEVAAAPEPVPVVAIPPPPPKVHRR